jgi:hypothetical protein
MEKQNKTRNLERAIKMQQEEIAKLKKQIKHQKWWNVYLLWSR